LNIIKATLAIAMRVAGCISASAAAAPLDAATHNLPGTTNDVRLVETINAPIDQVWDFVGDFAGGMRWNPLLVSCNITWMEGRLARTAHFAGWWLTERLDRRDPQHHRIDYTIIASTRPEVVGSKASITLTAGGARITRLEWTEAGPANRPAAPGSNVALTNYYRVRVGHLRTALGVQ
jgi:uncharacterized protein YndB with AHSA1/START domain